MENINLNLPLFIVIFSRITGFLMFVPFFKTKGFSITVKAGFAFMVTILLFPVINSQITLHFNGLVDMAMVIGMEFLVGFLMGLSLMILLVSIRLAGHVMGFQMVFTMARTVDPSSGSQTNVISVFLVSIFVLMIIVLGGDHFLIKVLSKSFLEVKPGEIIINKSLISYLVKLLSRAFEMGFKILAPVMILLFLIDLTLGIIGKTSQKMQIFFVGIPLKITLGLLLLTLILGFIVKLFGKELNRSLESIFLVLKTI